MSTDESGPAGPAVAGQPNVAGQPDADLEEWAQIYYPIADPIDYRIGSIAAFVGGHEIQLAVSDDPTGFTYPRLPILCSAHPECQKVAEYVAVDDGVVTAIACRHHGPEASLCVDCGTETFPSEQYMVHDAVWPADLGPGGGMLCVGCLEARLGRQLTSADFTAAVINDTDSYISPRLRARLTSGGQQRDRAGSGGEQ